MITHDHLDAFCHALPGTTADFPFDAETRVYRVLGKIYALTDIFATPVRVNLKCDPDWALALRDQYPDVVTPGYHMNKRHWNTVLLDGTLADDDVWQMVRHAYDRVVSGLTRAQRAELAALGADSPDTTP